MHRVSNPSDKYVLDFCADVVPGSTPVPVICKPLPNAPDKECFPLVEDYVHEHGGSSKIGWAIWELPGAFIEAEFHAVWRSPDGQYWDIVPRARQCEKILFLPDAARRYLGKQVDNVRKALVRDNDVKRFLFLFTRQFQIMNAGELANQHGVISLPERARREGQAIQKEAMRLELRIKKRYAGKS
jgi:hypothetical protein